MKVAAPPAPIIRLDGVVRRVLDGFLGDVDVEGTLSKSAGSFKIDHPLDPANKYLYHSFVESPDMMNVYNGVITLDVAQQALAMPFAMSLGDTLLIEEGSALTAMKDQLIALGHQSIRIAPAPIKANALGRRADGAWEVATEPRNVSQVMP